MANVRKKIDQIFEKTALFIYQHKILVILAVLLVTFILVFQIPNIQFDTSTEGFLHQSDPTLIAYNEFRDYFGRDEMVIIAIQSKHIFSKAFIRKLDQLQQELENNVPYIKEITSLLNARNVYGQEDELIVEDLLEDYENRQIDFQSLKQVVLEDPLYKNLIISEDGTFTTITIESMIFQEPDQVNLEEEDILKAFEESEPAHALPAQSLLTDEQLHEQISMIKQIIKSYQDQDFKLYIAGTQVMIDDLKIGMVNNMRLFTSLCLLIIFIFLILIFRNVSGVLLPFIVVILTLVSTIGLMAWTKVPIQLPTQILPSFLLVVGVGASVHVLALFYYRIKQGHDRQKAIIGSIKHSGLAIVMTGLTTAAGLFSFSFAEIAPVSKLGIFGAAGVLLSLLYTIILLPALVALLPIKKTQTKKEKKGGFVMDRILGFFARFSCRYSLSIIIISLLLIIFSLAALFRINFSHNPIAWLPRKSNIQENFHTIDQNLKGSTTVEVIIDTGRKNGVKDPYFLNQIERFKQSIQDYSHKGLFVGKIMDLNQLIKEIHQALNENKAGFYQIPDNSNLIAQELLLFENSGGDDLEKLVDPNYQKTRLTIKVPMLDALLYVDFVRFLDEQLEQIFNQQAKITITGFLPLLTTTLYAVMTSTAKSYIIAFVVITLMMIVLIGRLGIGLLSMIPNLLPIFFVLGIMEVAGIALDMFVMLVGCIAIGLAVDDTIHFMHNFRRYYLETQDARQAIDQTLLSTGRAMLTTSVVLCAGFFIYLLSSMSNLFNFGLLTGLAIIIALLSDFLLAPALMYQIYKKKQQAERKPL